MKHTGTLLIIAASSWSPASKRRSNRASRPTPSRSNPNCDGLALRARTARKGTAAWRTMAIRHPQDSLGAGATLVLMDITGSG